MSSEKDIEIKIKATGGEAAAREIERVEAASADLGDQVDDLGSITDGAAASADDLATKSGGLGSRLVAMAGGPVTIAITAVTAFASWLASLKARIDAVSASQEDFRTANRATSDRLAESGTAAVEAAAALDKYQAAMSVIVDGTDVAVDAITRRTDAAKDQRAAAADLMDALDALAVAEGRMDKDEAAARKAGRSESDVRANVEADLAAAAERAKVVNAAVEKAMTEVVTARAALAKTEAQIAASRTEAETAAQALKSQATRKSLEIDREKVEGAPDLITAARRGGILGIAGAGLDYGLQMRAQAEAMEKLMAERDKLHAQAEAILEGEKKNAEKLAPAADAARDKLAAATAAMEKLRAEQAAAAQAVGAASQQRNLAETYQIPAMRAREGARKATETAREQAAQAAADAEADKAAEAARINQAASALAAEAGRTLAGAEARGADAALIRDLEGIINALADGTNNAELLRLTARLAGVAERVKAEGDATRTFVDQLARRLNAMESQTRAARS